MCKFKLNKEIAELFSASEDISERVYTVDQIQNLPEPVQRYFRYSLKENQPFISYVRFKHGGLFKPSTKWLKIKGQEYFTIQNPGFIWVGKIPLVSAKDMYLNGVGNLVIKLLSFIKIADVKGKEIDQGELLRWLGEIPCAPTALLPSEHLRWEVIDDHSAKVILTVNELTVEGIFIFNEEGQITHFKAKRYYEKTLEDWTGYYNDYRTVNGMKVPFYIEVAWNLEEGDLTYAKFNIETIEHNIPSRY